MYEEEASHQAVIADYLRQAARYDTAVHRFDLFARFGIDISSWRPSAIVGLELKPGNTVVDIGGEPD